MGGGPTFDPDSVKIQKIDCAYPSSEPKFNVTLTMADGTTSTFSPDKEQVVKGLSVDGNTLKVSYNGGQAETSLDLPKSKTVTGFAIVDGKLVLTLSEGAPFVVPLPAHTDKFVDSATFDGRTLKFGYNDKTGGPSVDLSKLDKFVTGGSVANNQLKLKYNGGGETDPITLPQSDGKYVIGGQVTDNQLTLNYNLGGTTAPITLPSSTDKYVTSGSVTGNQLTLNYNLEGSTPVKIPLPKVVSDVTKDGENLIITYSDGTSNKFNLPAPKNDGVYKDGNGTWYYGNSNRVRKRLSTTGTNGSATGLNASITGASLGCTALSISTGGVNWSVWVATNTTAGFAGTQTGQKIRLTGAAEDAAASNLEQTLTNLKTEVSANVVTTVKTLMGPLKTSGFGMELK